MFDSGKKLLSAERLLSILKTDLTGTFRYENIAKNQIALGSRSLVHN
jgi:hypothetical protein